MCERLTKRNSDGSVGINNCRYYNYDDFQKMAKKLADYEDAEEQGRIIVPPCKVGDELYRIITPNNKDYFLSSYPAKVAPYGVYFRDIFGEYSYLPFDDFGKTVFLTREEAETKLKMQKLKK